MAHQITVGPIDFPSKTAAKSFFRAIRDHYEEDGIRIEQVHDELLRDLVALHPGTDEKVGCGIDHFTVATDSKYRTTRHFVIHRIDGECTDFSFHTCIDGSNARRNVMDALRRAVESQIIGFRNSFFDSTPNPACPIRGVALTKENYHVDHEPPDTFAVLARRWMEAEGLTPERISVSESKDNQITTEMTAEQQRSSWSRFHAARARLRVVSSGANLSEIKKVM